MVGIVIVSHSQKISEGIVELSKQMAQSEVRILSAGGTRDGRIGTDATMIMEAIKKADSGEGVLLLGDLGSAIMSSETAIELLGEEMEGRVEIADAPLVEGAIVAIIEASIGSDLQIVKEIAEQAKKQEKL